MLPPPSQQESVALTPQPHEWSDRVHGGRSAGISGLSLRAEAPVGRPLAGCPCICSESSGGCRGAAPGGLTVSSLVPALQERPPRLPPAD